MAITGLGRNDMWQSNACQNAGQVNASENFNPFYQRVFSDNEAKMDDSEASDFSEFIHNKINEMAEKIKNGDTEPTFQIGGGTYTKKEWEQLLEKVDRSIDKVKEEIEEEDEEKTEETVTEKLIAELLRDREIKVTKEEGSETERVADGTKAAKA